MLRERIITALILGPLLIWAVLGSPPTITVAIITAVILLGAWEWSQFCGWSARLARGAYIIAIALTTLAVAWLSGGLFGVGASNHPIEIEQILLVAAVWWLCALAWLLLLPLRTSASSTAIAGVLVLVPPWVALVKLQESSRELLLFLLILVVAADIAAYFAGRAFGRVKLAPHISPGKTWEGAFGGVAGATLVAFWGAHWFNLPVIAFMSLCLATVLASIIGDLTESMFKRCVGLKDSGSLLPGHGGILDRLDSLTAAAPLFALGMIWMGVLT